VQLDVAARRQLGHPQPAVSPARDLRGDRGDVRPLAGAAVREEPGLARVTRAHSISTTASTAPATSSSGGNSSERPMTKPRTVGSARVLRQLAMTALWSGATSPPRISAGSVDAAMTRSMSSTYGTLRQVEG